MLQKVIDTLLGVPPWLALLIIAGLVFGEAALFLGFVLPGETAVVYGGVLAEAGKVSVIVVLAVVIGSAIVGDSCGFEVGRRLGPRLVRAP
ncbi:MAG: DedA family protein, partial [Nocardioides sp.]